MKTSPPLPEETQSCAEPSSTLWSFATMLILGCAIPLSIVDWSNFNGSPQNVALAWLITLFSAARLATLTSEKRVDLLDVGVYMFIYVFVGVTPLAQTATGVFPLDGRSYGAELQFEQLIVFLFGILAFELGRRLVHHKSMPAYKGLARQFNPVAVVTVGGIGLLATIQQTVNNGFAAFFISRSETARLLAGQTGTDPLYTAVDKTGIAIQTALAQFPVFVALFAILYSRRHGLWSRHPTTDLFWRAAICTLAAANVVVNNPIGNSRLWGVLVIFAFSSIYIDYRRRDHARAFLVTGIAVLLLAFPLLDAFRFTNSERTLEFDPRTALVRNESYPVFQMALNGGLYVDAVGHTSGHQLLSSSLAFVPRSIWPEKAEPTGQLVDPRYLRAASAWTEAFVDFGLPGVVVVFFAGGVVLRKISGAWRTAPPGILHAVVPIGAIYVFFILRGSLLPALGTFYQLAFIFAVAAAFCHRPKSRYEARLPKKSVRVLPHHLSGAAHPRMKNR